ncbi:MAG: TauD/TfdA family dioxygenase [Rhodospirillaceae bacterium]|jgi:taurine dioxygenase|nr:TauD/TfdA family dioxygenase [Rhodospirillaceae bacterium]MBT4689392.1 TauD/TfdA family dioxygenase [Rhodospirillaceae bacterium]MBT5081027.1 TauD/TfdA family dioxygenase [Rhodospirillaceae bacterium]MBT5526170.1 TauD/TfdA family dioxygenase [Rhodospirillaceae bacterium]MBT5879698.1 TauD/TfdA family dioxygenase [Rhodospirillaceae bacterium]
MTLQIKPLCEALGAEVTGLDLSKPMAGEEGQAVHEAFLKHHLLCFRSPPLSPADFADVAGKFGTLQPQLLRSQRDGEVPEVSILDSTYVRVEDKPDDMRQMRLTGWHTDDSYLEVPAKATLLQSIEIPKSGGQTSFCNTQAAYEDLSEAEKQRLDGLFAVHRYDTPRAPVPPKARTQAEIDETPEVVHPLVRTNEDTGQKALYFNANRTDRVADVSHAESEEILNLVYDSMTQARYRYDHEWQVGDLLIWDNRCLVHSVNMDFPVGQRRLHQRILLRGDRPV